MDIHENFDPPVGDDADLDIGVPEPEYAAQEPHIIEKIAAINNAFEHEVALWDKNGLNPAGLQINMAFLNWQVGSFFEYVYDKIPGFDKHEWELKWKTDLVEALIRNRLGIIAEKTRQDITAGIIGPDGNPIKVPKT